MTQDIGRAPRDLGAGDPVRQQQLIQRQLQQQRLEQQLQHQQLQQHLQRQQLLQHHLQQQLQQQWSPQLNPTICPSYSYPLSSAVSPPPLLPPAGTYPQPTIAATSVATSVEPGVSAAAPGSPPLSLRDILHILGESVAVLECLRVLLLQLLQWGGEVGALLQASFLQHLVRFFVAAGISAFCRVKRGCALFSFSPTSVACQPQPQPHHQGGEQGVQLQHRSPLLRRAWQLAVSPFIKILPAAPVDAEATMQGRRKGEQNLRENSLSRFSKTAAAAGTIVATSSAATRQRGGLLKLLSGRIGGFLHGALFFGILYRIYLQWRKYRRLLKRYRRLAARMSARQPNRVEEAEEATALMTAEVESGTRKHTVEETATCRFEEDRAATEISTTAATTAAATGTGNHIPLHRDACMQTQHSDKVSALTPQQPLSTSACVVDKGAKQHPESSPEKAAGWPQTTPTTTAPWTALDVGATSLTSVPRAVLGASFPVEKPYTETAGCTHPAIATRLQAPAGSAPREGSATLVPAASQPLLLHALSSSITTKPEAKLAATPQPATALPPQVAAVRPSPAPAGAASVSRPSAAETGGEAGPLTYVRPSAGSGSEAAATPAAAPAAADLSKKAVSCSPPAASGSGELLRHFLRARAQQVKDPSKAALWAVSLDSLRAAVTPADTASTEGATSAERAVAAGEGRSAAKQPVSPMRKLVAGAKPAARLAGTSNKADFEAGPAAVVTDGVSSAGELPKTHSDLRQRAASWSERLATKASADLAEAPKRAVAFPAAARLPSAAQRQGSRAGDTVCQPWTQLLPPTAASSSTGASGTAVTLPRASTALDLQATFPAGTAAEASLAAASENVPFPSGAPTVPSAVLLSPAVPAVGVDAGSTAAATDPVCGPSSTTATATDLARKEINDFVEEQLRCFKAAEKRTTPAFQGNPFLRLCHRQQQREQQEKHRQQLLEQEFSRTDIPPWERGSTLESEGGEHSMYTSYWKAPFFTRVRAPQAATPWPPPSPLLLSATRDDVLPQKARPPEVSRQTQQQQHKEQQHAGLHHMPQQPHKKDGVVQRQEDWLPTQLHPLGHSVGPSNDTGRRSVIVRQRGSVPAQGLLDGKPRQPHMPVAQTAMSAQGRVLQPSTYAGAATAHTSLGAALPASGEASSSHRMTVSPSLRGSSGTQVESGTNSLGVAAGRRYSASSAAGGEVATTEAEAAAGPTVRTAAEDASAVVAAQNEESARVWFGAADTTPTAANTRSFVGSRQGNSIICSGTAKSSSVTRGQSLRRHSAVDGAAVVGGGTAAAAGPPPAAAAGHVTVAVAPGAGRPRYDREDYFAGTACSVRRQQETKLRQLLRTHTLHQKQQKQPQQQVQQQVQHQLHQQGRKDCSTHGTPSTASDADWLAELAAAAAGDGAAGRYYYPELYV